VWCSTNQGKRIACKVTDNYHGIAIVADVYNYQYNTSKMKRDQELNVKCVPTVRQKDSFMTLMTSTERESKDLENHN